MAITQEEFDRIMGKQSALERIVQQNPQTVKAIPRGIISGTYADLLKPLTNNFVGDMLFGDIQRGLNAASYNQPITTGGSFQTGGIRPEYLMGALALTPVGKAKAIGGKFPLTEFEVKQLTAQRNAALPVAEGGLGLPAINTAMDRAKALGFDVNNPVYHGTDKSFDAFDLNKIGSQTSMPSNFPKGIYTSPNVEVSLNYGKGEGQNVIPLLMNKQNPISITDDITSAEAFKRFNAGDADTFLSNNVAIARNPNQLRSTNAAFDPFRRNEADILAGVGVGVPVSSGLLDIENKKVPKKEKKKTK
jgi:hypothetical protein